MFFEKSPLEITVSPCYNDVDLCGFLNVSFIRSDARKIGKARSYFDLVFMDAPYNKGLTEPVLENLFNKGYLSVDTLLIVEVEKNEAIALDPRFILIDERVYGVSKVLFLKIANAHNE